MASFHDKTGWERPRKGEKKLSFRSVPTRPVIVNSKKIEKEFKKLKNIIMTSFQTKTGWQRPKNREKKFIVPIISYLTRNRKLKKKKQKNSKN